MIGMVITHNILGMNAQRQYNIVGSNKKKSTEKLSSGFKINRAADDAAGLTISEKMRRNIRGLNQASKNIQDGISLLQVADGALNEDHAILQRMNELAVQAANGTNTVADRAAIQAEIRDLIAEVDRIANSTSFNAEIFPLNHGNFSEIDPSVTMIVNEGNVHDEQQNVSVIDLGTLTNGSYPGFTLYDGKITITDGGTYAIKNSVLGRNSGFDAQDQSLIVASDATIILETSMRVHSGSCITVEDGVDAVFMADYSDGFLNTTTYGEDPGVGFELKDNCTVSFVSSSNEHSGILYLSNPNGCILCGNNTTINIDNFKLIVSEGYGKSPLFADNCNSSGSILNLYNDGEIGHEYRNYSNYAKHNSSQWPLERVNIWTGRLFCNVSSEVKERARNSINFIGIEASSNWTVDPAGNLNINVWGWFLGSDEGPQYLNPSGNDSDKIWIQAGDDAGEGIYIQRLMHVQSRWE